MEKIENIPKLSHEDLAEVTREDLEKRLTSISIERGNMETALEWLEGVRNRLDKEVYQTMVVGYQNVIKQLTAERYTCLDAMLTKK